ncbi:hypothetical protein J4450_02690 [Candidatus Micrarchaeota archaeon]|nr:hypothetical protein [Candidatus Micrarchaeota archaeon]
MGLIGNLGRAAGLLAKTWPFLVIRFLGLLAISVISLILFVILIVALAMLGANAASWGIILIIILFLGFTSIYSFLSRYFIFLYDAGHVAVMAKILKGETADIPTTWDQLNYGKDIVIKRIGSLSALYVFKQIVYGILYAVNRAVGFFTSFMPSSIKSLIGFIMRIINRAIFLIFDITLSYLVFEPTKNAWMCAADSLVIYKKNLTRFLMVAAALVILGYVVSFIGVIFAYTAYFATGSAIMSSTNTTQVFSAILGLIFVFMIFEALRQSVVIPYSRALVLCEFFDILATVKISQEDYGILNNIPQFQELLKKANEPQSPPAVPPAPAK